MGRIGSGGLIEVQDGYQHGVEYEPIYPLGNTMRIRFLCIYPRYEPRLRD